jgi:hypothetical protein
MEPGAETVMNCKISAIAKRRDGSWRYWCSVHQANATGARGVRLSRCQNDNAKPLPSKDILVLDPTKYPGGVAIWGAVPAVYTTASHDMDDLGVHVHARQRKNEKKLIDQTFKQVVAEIKGANGSIRTVEIGKEEAISYMASSIFGHAMEYVECRHCGKPHLDKDWFAVHHHRKHLCYGCGRDFHAPNRGIGNPLMGIKAFCGDAQVKRKTVPAARPLDVKQSDFPLGIELWGSHEAILWTGKKPEEHGLHFHGYIDSFVEPAFDETYDDVTIDGVRLDCTQLRILMAQHALPHLAGRVVSLECPSCERPHFDRGELAYTPHKLHSCECGTEFSNRGRLKNVIGNPMVATLATLQERATRPRRKSHPRGRA